jgi:hypothetical protein
MKRFLKIAIYATAKKCDGCRFLLAGVHGCWCALPLSPAHGFLREANDRDGGWLRSAECLAAEKESGR